MHNIPFTNLNSSVASQVSLTAAVAEAEIEAGVAFRIEQQVKLYALAYSPSYAAFAAETVPAGCRETLTG